MGEEVSLYLNFTTLNELFTIRHVKALNFRLILCRVWNRIPLITHPLIDVGPDTILTYPNLSENATKLAPRIRLWASEFDFDIILLRCDRLHTPFLELLLREEAKLLLLSIRSARLRGVNT